MRPGKYKSYYEPEDTSSDSSWDMVHRSSHFSTPTSDVLTPELLDSKDRRLRETLTRLQRLSQQFIESKEKIYQERYVKYNVELEGIENGTHEEYLVKIAELEEAYIEMVKKYDLEKEYMEYCANALFEAEVADAEEEYMAERQGLREKMIQSLEEKRRRLIEDRDLENSPDPEKRPPARKLRSNRRPEQTDTKPNKRKQPTIPRPVMHFTLKENEIFEDLYIMRRGSGHMNKKPRR